MHHKDSSTRQKLHTCASELVRLMLDVSEAEQKTLPEPEQPELSARYKTLAALTLAVRENIRAFLTVDEHMK